MLRNIKDIFGHELRATDGPVGEIRDVYFDDHSWNVRYFVVKTGHWLNSRLVLISPEVAKVPEWNRDILPVSLTKDQVKNSPDIDTAKPVSRQHESALRRYYGWPTYWGSAGVPDAGFTTAEAMPGARVNPGGEARHAAPAGEPTLRSAHAVAGYSIEATDGGIGHVEDFLVDDQGWRIRYLVIDTRNWLPGRKVVVSPEWIREVSWDESRVFVDHTVDAIKRSPVYDPAKQFDAEYASKLHDYYGRPRYVDWEPSQTLKEARRPFDL